VEVRNFPELQLTIREWCNRITLFKWNGAINHRKRRTVRLIFLAMNSGFILKMLKPFIGQIHATLLHLGRWRRLLNHHHDEFDTQSPTWK